MTEIISRNSFLASSTKNFIPGAEIMAPKLFMYIYSYRNLNLSTDSSNRTGVTGYIGGSVFATLIQRHPEYDLTVLLRNPPENFGNLFPKVKVIKGDFDNIDVITNAAADAEVVVRKNIRFSQNEQN